MHLSETDTVRSGTCALAAPLLAPGSELSLDRIQLQDSVAKAERTETAELWIRKPRFKPSSTGFVPQAAWPPFLPFVCLFVF